ncbi:hypothetical protein ACO0KY_10725 [Undibacterium sp. Dicai25W]|uniref:hypothetical protein n=1 Tax=Undibacterium sp. Dicai25W TaxID=3413034 RepID=UPI003BF243C7
METISQTLKDLELSETQNQSINKVSCKSCSNAMWQNTDKGIIGFCRITFRDSFSEQTGARIYNCDGKANT